MMISIIQPRDNKERERKKERKKEKMRKRKRGKVFKRVMMMMIASIGLIKSHLLLYHT